MNEAPDGTVDPRRQPREFFFRLHKYFGVNIPAKADEKTRRLIDRAGEEAWSLRRIQGSVKAIISGTAKFRDKHPVFSDNPQRLTIYLPVWPRLLLKYVKPFDSSSTRLSTKWIDSMP